MLKKLQWILVCTATLSAGSAFAQVGLLEIYQLALRSDPALREAEAIYLATRETKPQARSNYLPNVSLSGSTDSSFQERDGTFGFGAVDFGQGDTSRSHNDGANLNVVQTLFDMSSLRQLRQADKVVAQAEINLEAARQDLLVRVSGAYFNVLAAEALLEAETASREAIARQLEQAQRRFDVGLIAITDVQQAQAAYDIAVATEIGAQRTLATQQEFLREITGEYVTDLRGPTGELELLPPEPPSPDDWVDLAMQQNLVLAASRIGTEIAQDDIGILRAARFPTLELSGGYNTGSSENRSVTNQLDGSLEYSRRLTDTDRHTWSIDLRFPIYTGGFNSSRIQQAVYQHRAAQESLERIARQTERQTRDAYLGVTSEISRVQALRQAVESNRTALRATEAGFEVGTQTTVDVLAAQDSLRRAETNYAISRYDYIINLLALREAAGSLSEENIATVDGW
ncbi:MAG TPA: TolC family outer membrane protein, partial [Gammaproteobacteria bacterium]|nr:TolC family outer membrane protein [Gammaproteobacteria bacterium]